MHGLAGGKCFPPGCPLYFVLALDCRICIQKWFIQKRCMLQIYFQNLDVGDLVLTSRFRSRHLNMSESRSWIWIWDLDFVCYRSGSRPLDLDIQIEFKYFFISAIDLVLILWLKQIYTGFSREGMLSPRILLFILIIEIQRSRS